MNIVRGGGKYMDLGPDWSGLYLCSTYFSYET